MESLLVKMINHSSLGGEGEFTDMYIGDGVVSDIGDGVVINVGDGILIDVGDGILIDVALIDVGVAYSLLQEMAYSLM